MGVPRGGGLAAAGVRGRRGEAPSTFCCGVQRIRSTPVGAGGGVRLRPSWGTATQALTDQAKGFAPDLVGHPSCCFVPSIPRSQRFDRWVNGQRPGFCVMWIHLGA